MPFAQIKEEDESIFFNLSESVHKKLVTDNESYNSNQNLRESGIIESLLKSNNCDGQEMNSLLSSQEQHNVNVIEYNNDDIQDQLSSPSNIKKNKLINENESSIRKVEKINLKNTIINSIKSIGKDNTSQISSHRKINYFEKNISSPSLNKSLKQPIKNHSHNSTLTNLQNKINSSHMELENISSNIAEIKPLISILLQKTPFNPNQPISKELNNLLINFFSHKNSSLHKLDEIMNKLNRLNIELKESNILQKYYLQNLIKSQINNNESTKNNNYCLNHLSDSNNSQLSKNYKSNHSDTQSLFQKNIVNEVSVSKNISNSLSKGSLINTLVNRKRCLTDSHVRSNEKSDLIQSSNKIISFAKKDIIESSDQNNNSKKILTKNLYLNNSAKNIGNNELKNSFNRNLFNKKSNKKIKSKQKFKEINIYNSKKKSKNKKNSNQNIHTHTTTNSQQSLQCDTYYSVDRKNNQSIYEEYKRIISEKIPESKNLKKNQITKLNLNQEPFVVKIKNKQNLPVKILKNQIVNLNDNNLYKAPSIKKKTESEKIMIHKLNNNIMKLKVPFNSKKSNQIFQINKFIYSPQNIESNQHFPNFTNYNPNIQLLSNSHQLNRQNFSKTEVLKNNLQNKDQLNNFNNKDNIYDQINNKKKRKIKNKKSNISLGNYTERMDNSNNLYFQSYQ